LDRHPTSVAVAAAGDTGIVAFTFFMSVNPITDFIIFDFNTMFYNLSLAPVSH